MASAFQGNLQPANRVQPSELHLQLQWQTKKKASKNVEKHTTSTAERLEKTKGNTGHNLLAIDLGRGLVAPDTKPVLRLDIMCEAFK